jgi:hypothetical protein
MPLLIIFKNDTPCEAIVGVHDAASIDDKLKGVFL